ncbi:uncharacterized protein LOC132927277 [Rhopalosiphum padi]|nr:uncharacterized protein LOC132923759 [Rhopalosiphum padi]XP_060847762.1 uncharacterized protein LOC132927277 [Rhopalosiphum padi]
MQQNRLLGKAYIGFQRQGKKVSQDVNKDERKMKPTCASTFCNKSKNRYCDNFSKSERSELFNHFWNNCTSWAEKKTFCVNMITKTETKRIMTENEKSRRDYSYTYHLKKEDISLPVCKKMFLNTLCLNEWMVRNWINSSINGLPQSTKNIKKNNLQNNLNLEFDNEEEIEEPIPRVSVSVRHNHLISWFGSLPKMPSHYCRKRSERLYLEGPFNSKQEVYDVYLLKCKEENMKPLSRSFFSRFMTQKKFSIYQPRKDLCDTCSSYKVKQVNEENYELHIAQKNQAREELKVDTLDAVAFKKIVLTMDLQAVKLCPALNASALYYSMKLKVHNFTVYNLEPNHPCSNYWWDESQGELEASVFTSIILNHIKQQCIDETQNKKKDIIIYSDGCGYQNRNTVLSNALLKFSIENNVIIEQKFLVKGHTQMPCDSVHSSIERTIKNKEIYLPSDYMKLTKLARKNPSPYESHSVNYSDFYDYKKLNYYKSIRPGRSKGDPEVRNIRALKYDPTTKKIYYKINFEHEYTELPQYHRTKKTIDLSINTPCLYNSRIPITLSKWIDLQKLKTVLPTDVHDYYDNIPHLKTYKERKCDKI